MKFSVLNTNINKNTGNTSRCYDAFIEVHFLKQLDKIYEYTTNHNDADFTILPLVWEKEYIFDISIKNEKIKNLIIIDYFEYGWFCVKNEKYNSFYSLFGLKHEPYDNFFINYPEFEKLHKCLLENFQDKIKVYFKRELNHADTSILNAKILPADYCSLEIPIEPVSKDNFLTRNLKLTHMWGRSSTDRMIMHGFLMTKVIHHGNIFTSHEQYTKHIKTNDIKNCILLLHKEFFERIPFKNIYDDSIAVLDMYGCGMKCFRNSESLNHSISIKQDNTMLKHAYDFIHGENCIQIPNYPNSNRVDLEKSHEIIIKYLFEGSDDLLYSIYLKSNELYRKYYTPNYIKDYIIPNIISNIC